MPVAKSVFLKPKLVETRNFKNYCSARFCEELSRELHNCLANHQDPNLMWDILKNKFLKIADKHAPSKVGKVKSIYTPWFSKDITKQLNHRHYLKKKLFKLTLQPIIAHLKELKIMLIKLKLQNQIITTKVYKGIKIILKFCGKRSINLLASSLKLHVFPF